jgi:formyl-CoA transferase
VNLHRNKRGLALDLKHPEGHAAFLRLADTADVVVENMRVAVKHRLRVDYATLSARNPRLVYASISGFGQSGPYAARGGVDQIAQGMGGLMSITGEAGRGPMRVGIPINDLTAGNLLALGRDDGALRAREDRARPLGADLAAGGAGLHAGLPGDALPPGRRGGRARRQRPPGQHADGVFPSADKPINIAASSPRLWEVFCRAVGRGGLAGEARVADRPPAARATARR